MPRSEEGTDVKGTLCRYLQFNDLSSETEFSRIVNDNEMLVATKMVVINVSLEQVMLKYIIWKALIFSIDITCQLSLVI